MGLTNEQILERDKSLQRLQITTFLDKLGYVFISYKSDNWKKVFEEKVFALQEKGLRVYSDKNFDDTNHPWLEDMEKNLKHSSAVLMFISKEYLKSYATLIELLTAIKFEKQIVPVYLENKNDLFEDLTDDVDLEIEIVKMQPGEAKRLIDLLAYGGGKIFGETIRQINIECASKIEQQKFSTMNIVEAFEKILSSAELKDNLFDKDISSLVNTIEDAASSYTKRPVVFGEPVAIASVGKATVVTEVVTETVQEEMKVQGDVVTQNTKEAEVTQRLAQPEETAQSEQPTTPAQPETDSQSKKKVFSVTGDITYTLYGETYTENQSDMMLRFFAQVLKRHQDVVAELPNYKGMNCASAVNYMEKENRTDSMPSYFRVCQYFRFENGQAVCVGTAYGLNDKLKKMAALLKITGESEDVFASEQVELPAVKAAVVEEPSENGGKSEGRGNSSSVSYTVFGQAYTTNQVDMMCNIFRAFVEKHPDLLEEMAENFTCVALADYSHVAKEDKPTYFATGNTYEINGKKYTIGGSYGMKEKIRLIEKLIAFCDEVADSVVIEGVELNVAPKTTGRGKKEKSFL